MTEGRVSPRRASVLANITNQLLHTHFAVLKEDELVNKSQPIIFDLPAAIATEAWRNPEGSA